MFLCCCLSAAILCETSFLFILYPMAKRRRNVASFSLQPCTQTSQPFVFFISFVRRERVLCVSVGPTRHNEESGEEGSSWLTGFRWKMREASVALNDRNRDRALNGRSTWCRSTSSPTVKLCEAYFLLSLSLFLDASLFSLLGKSKRGVQSRDKIQRQTGTL